MTAILERRHRLADRVFASRSRAMPTPCSNCRTAKPARSCRVSLASGRCSECISRNVKCDLVVTEKDWQKVDDKESQLRSQLSEARRIRDEAFAREERLMKELQFLESRKEEMARRELASIEELEKLEAEERAVAEASRHAAEAPASLGWPSLDDPQVWAEFLNVDGNPPLSPGTLSGS